MTARGVRRGCSLRAAPPTVLRCLRPHSTVGSEEFLERLAPAGRRMCLAVGCVFVGVAFTSDCGALSASVSDIPRCALEGARGAWARRARVGADLPPSAAHFPVTRSGCLADSVLPGTRRRVFALLPASAVEAEGERSGKPPRALLLGG